MSRWLVAALCLLAFPAWADMTVPNGQSGYVYATASGTLRRIVVANTGAIVVPVGPGETGVVQSPGASTDQSAITAAIASAIGRTPQDPRCAVLMGGVVVDIIGCDPALDSISGATLKSSKKAAKDDKLSGGSITNTFTEYNPTTSIVDAVIDLDVDNQVAPIPGDMLVRWDGKVKVGQKLKTKKDTP